MAAPVGNKNALGGPGNTETIFTPELGVKICEALIYIGSLRKVCALEEMPSKATVFRWLMKAEEKEPNENYIVFRDQYIRAREHAKDYRFDELENDLHDLAQTPVIIDDKPLLDSDGEIVMTVTSASVQFANLHLNAFKWQSSKENPKKYGDKTENTHTHDISERLYAIVGNTTGPTNKDA